MRRFLNLPNVILIALAVGLLFGCIANATKLLASSTLGPGETELDGLTVTRVVEDSDSWRAGLRAGDRIVTLDGKPVQDAEAFRRGIRGRTPGGTVEVGIERAGKPLTLKVPLRSGYLREALLLGGDLFKALIMMVILPLVVFSLICGMMSIGDMRRLGRVAIKTLVLYTITAALACTVAIVLVNALRPGRAVPEEKRNELVKQFEADQKRITGPLQGDQASKNAPTFWSFVRSIVPTNVVKSLAEGQMLPVIFFALLFGLTAAMLETKRRDQLFFTFESITEAMIRMVQVVMWAAPAGVFCLIALATATLGLSVLKALALYCLAVVLGLLVQFFVVYWGVIRLLTRLRFTDFVRACRPALVTAFSTSSSAASLPVNMECVNKRLNVSTSVTSFVLPIGTTVNMDGTAIMQSVAAVFIAQLYQMELSATQQLMIILTAMLAAVGTAPVPSAGIAMLVLILEPLKIPVEGIALIWAVDRPLDMLRTVVNVVGDGVAAAAVASTEGEDVRYVPEGSSLSPVSSPSSEG